MRRLSQSFSFAIQGIIASIANGNNMKLHLLAACSVVGLGLFLGLTRLEWAIVSITIFMVLAIETINTAIERTVDLITKDRHPLAKLAKDMAAGAVLLTAVNALVVALLIFGPYLIK